MNIGGGRKIFGNVSCGNVTKRLFYKNFYLVFRKKNRSFNRINLLFFHIFWICDKHLVALAEDIDAHLLKMSKACHKGVFVHFFGIFQIYSVDIAGIVHHIDKLAVFKGYFSAAVDKMGGIGVYAKHSFGTLLCLRNYFFKRDVFAGLADNAHGVGVQKINAVKVNVL